MTVIVYSSKSGSTKRYAESLSARTGIPAYPVGKQPDGEQIVFFGWLRFNLIPGLEKVDRSRIVALCVVGLDDEGMVYKPKISERNKVQAPLYYLRGHLNRKTLNPIDKFVFAIICARMKLKGFDARTGPIFDAMMNGGSFYDEKYLDPIETFVRSRQ